MLDAPSYRSAEGQDDGEFGSLPRLISREEFCRQLGGIGATLGNEIITEHQVEVVKVGARSMVVGTELDRVVGELRKASAAERANPDATPKKGGRVLAARSVEARRIRRETKQN